MVCIAHIIQLALSVFMTNLGVKGHTKSWEAHEQDRQFGENESKNIWTSQRLGKEGNSGINQGVGYATGFGKDNYESTYFKTF